MKHLSIDIETRSSVDIGSAGLYKYAQSEDFEILLLAYQAGEGSVQVIDLAQGEQIPEGIVKMLQDPEVVKHAYNAAFEWYCLNMAGYKTPLEQWKCTMAHALYCGYAAGLAATGNAIGLPEDKKKLSVGRALIRYFCVPCQPTKANGGRTWNLPRHAPEKWNLFKEYNAQDVVSEHEILRRLDLFPMPEEEEKLWQLDTWMNAFGVRVDADLIKGALYIDNVCRQKLTEDAVQLTGLNNPNSTSQLMGWLQENGIETEDIRKDTVAAILKGQNPGIVNRVLEIRQQLGKTSVKKYVAMKNAKCRDDRIRGLTQYYGANRTGRWAGRMVQMQNLPRNYLKTLDEARKIVKSGNYEGLRLIYGNVQGHSFSADPDGIYPIRRTQIRGCGLSAIEARVIAWLAGEQWVNEVFAGDGKIYEATASQMFGVPKERIKKGNPEYSLRQKGKVATLALGYQGGSNALIAMGALNMGLTEEELPDIVARWRRANRRICDLWCGVEQAALAAMQTAQPQAINGLIFALEGDNIFGQRFLTVTLPSRRKLFYPKPLLQPNQFGKMALHYYSVGQQSHKWSITNTYGGKYDGEYRPGDCQGLPGRNFKTDR